MFGRQRWLVLVVLGAMLLAACGSSGGDKSAEPSGDTSSDAPASQDAPASDEPGSSQGGGDFPDVADAFYTTGTMRVEVRGDRSEDFDLNASGFTAAGSVILTGADEENSAAAQIAWSSTEGNGGVSFTMSDLVSAGDLAACTLDLSKNDPTGLSGTIECDDIDGLANGITGLSLDLKIEFSVTP